MNSLEHIGVKRRSGRYPWGSGGDAYQSSSAFLARYRELRNKGFSEVEVAEMFNIKTGPLRSRVTIAKAEEKKAEYSRAYKLREKGYGYTEIGRMMNKNESSIRSLLDPAVQARSEQTSEVADLLKKAVADKKYVDVGVGVEYNIGVSRTKLKASLELLKNEGYDVRYVDTIQVGTGKKTSIMALVSSDVTNKELYENKHKIEMPVGYIEKDTGRSAYGLEPIKSISSSKIGIRYAEDGGTLKDGLIELKRGADGLSLGKSQYAQVRIGVDDTHYLKGMAVYSDTLPDGIDIIYNTNKSKTYSKQEVFKKMTGDPDNQFGATIKPGGQKGYINIVNEEGDWGNWSKTLSSQILSKQKPDLIKKQLNLAIKEKEEEYSEIIELTNPVIKRKLLTSFADDADASAVHLKAAALPRQGWHTILPFPEMKTTEVYAPNYNNGEKVVLIRHPHGGVFEIPELTVNNKQTFVKGILGRAKDAIGIHPKVAEQLSGADFDGDTVLVIPTNGKTIKTSSPLKDLQNFDPKLAYPGYDGMTKMTKAVKAKQMGDISNLITDMTIKGAVPSEIAKAVKHSMVVIDAEKHGLNYKQSALDNGIASLKEKYQGGPNKGAATLISRSKSNIAVPERKDRYKIDPKTGEKIYEETGNEYVNKQGKVVKRITSSTKMDETKNAFDLSSGTVVENIYATYANNLKSLANKARRDILRTTDVEYSPTAKKTYEKEVNSLNAKLNIALKNAPLERKAQLIANQNIKAKKESNPDLVNDKEALRKAKGQSIVEARLRTGASKIRVNIEPKEWEAIQAGALSTSKLTKIIDNTDMDVVKNYATPRTTKVMTSAKIERAKAMASSGYTQSEIATQLGVSTNLVLASLE